MSPDLWRNKVGHAFILQTGNQFYTVFILSDK